MERRPIANASTVVQCSLFQAQRPKKGDDRRHRRAEPHRRGAAQNRGGERIWRHTGRIDGERDHGGPWAIANAASKRQRRNPGATEIVKMPNRGHSLTIDHGWREVARTARAFVKRSA